MRWSYPPWSPLRPAAARSQLLARPTKLEVAQAERYGACDRPVDRAPAGALVVGGADHMASLVAGMTREWEAARPAEQPVVEAAAPAVGGGAGEPSAEGEPAAAAGDAEMQQE